MRILLKALKVKVVAIKTDAAGTLTEEMFEVTVDTNAPVDRIKRCHVLTLRCPVGIIFKKAGIEMTYKLNGEFMKGE